MPGGLKFDLAKQTMLIACSVDVLQFKPHSCLRNTVVWSGAMNRTLSVNWPTPAVQRLKITSRRRHRHLRHRHDMEDADENKISVALLPDFLAQQRALQIGENSGWFHI